MLGRTISHYEVSEKLGAGGMGVVFKARDTLLERTVVLKALPAESSADAEVRRRFLREARTASSLNHPNIITVHDVVSDDETDFIVMEFVEGSSIAEMLQGDGLTTRQALEVAIDVAGALEAAHEAGIVHRDIKPANVMVTDKGLVKVLDFGLAKRERLADADATGSAPLTQAGMLLGTLNYMSPEQALGRQVDSRSDVFSFGTMLYEMLGGGHPFVRDSAASVLHAVAYEDAAPIEEARPDLPAPLGPLVRKAMAKSPDERFRSMGELAEALRAVADGSLDDATLATLIGPASAARPASGPRALVSRLTRTPGVVAVLALVALLAIGWAVRQAFRAGAPRAAASAEAGVPRVGVVPLRNLTGDPELDWQGAGIASLVRDNLTQSRHLRVASAARIGELVAESDGDAALAANALVADVRYLLSGEIVKSPESLTLTARLSDAAEGTEVASRLMQDLQPESLLGAASQVADMVRQSLGVPRMEQVDVFAADFATEHMAAYELYVAGVEFLLRYDFPEAERSLATALELAPEFGAARYRLGQVQAATGRRPEGLESFRRAREEGSLSEREARYVEAAEALYSSRFEEAVERYSALVEEYPFDFEIRFLLAESLRASRRWQEEIDQLLVLRRQVPEYRVAWSMLTDAYLMSGRPADAAVTARQMIDTDPDDDNAHILLARALRAEGELDGAAEELRVALALNPSHGRSYLELATVELLAGDATAAERVLESLTGNEEIHPRNRVQGALELCFLRRAGGRFRDSAAILEELEPQFVGGVYEAQALSLRGLAALELGDLDAASRLVDLAVERRPARGAPNRYLLARGLVELARNQTDRVRETAKSIEAAARSADDAELTEERAAAYLRGLALLAEGKPSGAVGELSVASDLTTDDYPYAVYRVGLARALLAEGRLDEALADAREAAVAGPAADPRLDLELDRARAVLLQAEIQSAAGNARAAAVAAAEFLRRWSDADPDLADLAVAVRLSSG